MTARATNDMVRRLVPPLLPTLHKGQLGRVLVVGGCLDYSGAPYFSCMAANLMGADMCHILCSKEAGPVIKTYSPNLMVHPYLYETKEPPSEELPENIKTLMARMHVVLVGPGLGRNQTMQNQARQIIKEARRNSQPLVIDADGLFLVQNDLDLIKNSNAVLTPNVIEFGRLLAAVDLEFTDNQIEQGETLAKTLGVALLIKGAQDIITNGETTLLGKVPASPRRVSGQGDTLSGCLATFLAWRQAWNQGLWETKPIEVDTTLLCAYGASGVTRKASNNAFYKTHRAMLTTDVTNEVGAAFKELFD